MPLTLNQRETHLEQNPKLQESWKSLGTKGTRAAIFDVLTGKKFDTTFEIKVREVYRRVERTRRYTDINFYITLKKIQDIKKISKMHYTTHDKIIESVKEMMALEEALNTQRPQIIRDNNGQGRFDFFGDGEKKKEENPSSSAISSIPLSTPPIINRRAQQDGNEDQDDGGPHSRINDYYDN